MRPTLDMIEFAQQNRADFQTIVEEVASERLDDKYRDECDDDLILRRDLYVLLEKIRHDQVIQCPGQLSLFENDIELLSLPSELKAPSKPLCQSE